MSQPRPRVSFNRVSMCVSALFCLNLVCMPLKGYLSEVLWIDTTTFRHQSVFPVIPAHFNQTMSKRYVDQLQLLYNNRTLPRQEGYYYDSIHGVDVMRTVTVAGDCDRPPPQLLNAILGVVFFTPDLKLDLVDRLCKNESHEVARVWRVNFLDSPSFISAIWVVPNQNDLDGVAPPAGNATVATVYVLYIADIMSQSWREIKLSWRVAMCVLLAGIVGAVFAHPTRQLRHDLERFPIARSSPHDPPGKSPRVAVRYSVIVGEPSCLVLTSPWICVFFVVDLLTSHLYISQACLRVCQTTSLYHFGLGMLYLGRTVWYAYGALAGVNLVLQRWHKRDWVKPANSTILAIGAGVAGGGITNVQGQWPALLQVYTWLFALHSRRDPSSNQTVEMDSAVVHLVFMSTMCCLPPAVAAAAAVSRFVTKCLLWRRHNAVMALPNASDISGHRNGNNEVVSKDVQQMSSGWTSPLPPLIPAPSVNSMPPPLPHDARTKWLLWLCCGGNHPDEDVVHRGGSAAALLERDPAFRLHCTLNQRGGDFFICGFDASDALVDIMRITCVRGQLDLTHPRLVDSPTPSGVAIGSLHVSSSGDVTLHRGDGVLSGSHELSWPTQASSRVAKWEYHEGPFDAASACVLKKVQRD